MTRPPDIGPFDRYVKGGTVVEREADPAKAENSFDGARRKFRTMERLGIDEKTATDYFENVYEAVRMLVQSFMALDGFNPYSHEAIIAYAIDHLEVDSAVANRFDKFRKLRNDISYRGAVVTRPEANQVRELFLDLLEGLESNFNSRLP